MRSKFSNPGLKNILQEFESTRNELERQRNEENLRKRSEFFSVVVVVVVVVVVNQDIATDEFSTGGGAATLAAGLAGCLSNILCGLRLHLKLFRTMIMMRKG